MAKIEEDHTEPHNQSINDEHDEASSSSPEPAQDELVFVLILHLHGKPLEIPIHGNTSTIQDLSDTIAEEHNIPPSNQKFLITPKTGLLKPPFSDPTLLLSTLKDKKIVLMGATTTEVAELASDIADRRARMAKRRDALNAGRRVHAEKRRDWKKVQDEARYTFHTLRPLPYLPKPEKSMRFLERLRDDAGVKASMRKHGFSVGLLTEMNPAEHTTHESRTLGLNRNRGEVIELRLRTDAYDGYRDYKVIRKTLCHELAHNVWGEHDQRFWKLCKEIEAEVEKNDYNRGGHSVGGEEFYNPADEGVDDEDFHDHGGWTGGEYVLGGSEASTVAESSAEPLSRRDIIAKAAEDRIRRLKEAKTAEKNAKQS